jgi:hypothetical protein
VGLPRIPQRVRPHEREVEGRGDDHDPEALALPHGAIDEDAVDRLPDAEALRELEQGDRGGDERQRDEDAPYGLRERDACGREAEGHAEEEARGDEGHERPRDGAQRGGRDDPIIRVIERAQQVHDAPRGNRHEERPERDTPAELARVAHQCGRDRRGDQRRRAAAHDAQRVAARHEAGWLGLGGLRRSRAASAVALFLGRSGLLGLLGLRLERARVRR